jgi:hypothetical protein
MGYGPAGKQTTGPTGDEREQEPCLSVALM